MDERNMTLLTDWNGDDLTGWFISEKFNGCRAGWDGKHFWTRNGNIIKAPEWFTADLPRYELDGEIWAGYNQFEKARLAVQFGKFIDDGTFRFMIIDRPDISGTWDKRIGRANRSLYAAPVEFSRATCMADIESAFTAVKRRGGEGLVLRNPAILHYETGRTRNVVRMV